MKFMIRGKNIEVTDALKDYAKEKVGKIKKYFEETNGTVIEAHISLDVEGSRHIVEVTIFVDGLILRGEEVSGDMYASIDGVIEKLESQIRKHKTKIHRSLRQAKEEFKESIIEAREEDHNEEELKIVRTKRFAMKPMMVEEAAMQMDLLGHKFFVFSNPDGDINVIYKRNDGDYGLIAPEM